MLDPVELETTFKEFINHLNEQMPDGMIEINLDLLNSLNLLDVHLLDHHLLFSSCTDPFYMVETDEKLTLFNQDFIIWILPHLTEKSTTTYVLIANNRQEKPKLELVFSASGVYNSSKIVLNTLNAFLEEIKENESIMDKISYQPDIQD
ncbi:MAG: hypothetical protein P4L16_02655 [Chlamydiales bacterium]|nr:hypothetical protein [Chlamydiales bacterium]